MFVIDMEQLYILPHEPLVVLFLKHTPSSSKEVLAVLKSGLKRKNQVREIVECLDEKQVEDMVKLEDENESFLNLVIDKPNG